MKLKYEELLSNHGLKFNLRHYMKAALGKLVEAATWEEAKVGRCRLTPSNPR